MPAAARKGDIGSGHGCHFPPTNAIEGSPDVFINGKPAFRVGDALAAHGCPTCPAPAHGRALVKGSATVNINGKPAGRVGDDISCGGNMATGSPNVFIGDASYGSGADQNVPQMRFLLTQMPGDEKFGYVNEAYKLYHNGALVKEGITDEKGYFSYEKEDLSGEFMVEARHEKWTIKVQAHPPQDTKAGAESRLDAIGYNRYKKFKGHTPDAPDAPSTGLGWMQGEHGEENSTEASSVIKDLLKAIIP